ncbi:MAG TPA: galactosylceramidase [Bacillota bacterium]|nr:galactosylceramidase [Bacillota bacterium]
MAIFTTTTAAINITVDGASGGKIFDGVGMISGGGGNSRLLIDYPEPYRGQILDYLFKPNYGASLQVFKVEIGGDGNSTSGAEPSHMHTVSDENYSRGYQGWLLSEAKARNPAMIFECLPWGAPGWLEDYWSANTQNYIIKYIKGMEATYGIKFRTVGGKNESGYEVNWYIRFKTALMEAGLSTKLIGSDDWCGNWAFATEMKNSIALREAVDYIGFHTPHENKGSGNSGWPSTDAVFMRDTYGKPLWSSEDHYDGWGQGIPSATEMASALNMNYILGKITCTIFWTLVAACYDNIPYNNIGLIKCNQPWSGYYQINAPLWAMAHTTQFIQPGWQYLDSGCLLFNGDTTGKSGSIVCAKSANGSDWSAVVDMTLASTAQTLNFTVKNLSAGTVHVWATKATSTNPGHWFNKQTDITPSSGVFMFTAEPGYIFSLTTTIGQGKGTAFGPSSTFSLTLPYSDNFEGYATGKLARYFSDMNGSFETSPAGGGRFGNVLRQMAPITPITWAGGWANMPYTIMGSSIWTDYTVSCDVLLESEATVNLIGRINEIHGPSGYSLCVSDTGAWSILQTSTVLASGTVAALGINHWHNLALIFKGSSITAKIDNTTVTTLTDTSFGFGYVGLGVSDYCCVQFVNFQCQMIEPLL